MSKIYISSPVSKYQRQWNKKVSKVLEKGGHLVLLPQRITPKNTQHSNFEVEVYEKCVEMINLCDFGLLLYPYGRDCAWEVGYFKGISKPIYAFISKFNQDEKERLRDWMIKGSIRAVVTDNPKVLIKLKLDKILQNKDVFLVKNISELNSVLKRIY